MDALWQGDLARGLGLALISGLVCAGLLVTMRLIIGTRSSPRLGDDAALRAIEEDYAREAIRRQGDRR